MTVLEILTALRDNTWEGICRLGCGMIGIDYDSNY
jgi:hypothetical protein